MYTAEGVPAESVVFEDNAECVKLIEGKPYGLLSLLEEECSLGNATDLSYIAKIDKTFGTGKSAANKFFVKNKTKPDCFSVCHFAGAVEYNVANFLDKNRDTLSVTAREVMEASQVPLISELFTLPTDPNAATGGGKKASTKSTLGGQFRNQLIGLLDTLYKTEPHFIRCVKPNHQKVGGIFDGQLALRQLRYAGLFEAIRIRKSGFAYRATFRVFANSYQILVDGMTKKRKTNVLSDQDCCKLILEQTTVEKHLDQTCWFVGSSKVFLKTNAHRTILERLKVTRVTVYALRLQASCRAFVARMKANRIRYAALKEKARADSERDKANRAAKVIQKYIRRKLVILMMRSMHSLIELRKVLARKEVSKVKACLEKIDQQNKSASSAVLSAMFQHEVKVIRA